MARLAGHFGLGAGHICYSLFLHRFAGGKRLPLQLERALQLAVPAIFAALVVPLIVLSDGQLNMAQRWPHAVAAIVTGIYAGWRGGMLVSLLVGMGTLHGLLWWMGS